jgi:hypothetical protein
MLQDRRSPVRIPMRSLNFLIELIPSSRTMGLGSTQPLTEMSTRNLPGSKGGKDRNIYVQNDTLMQQDA